MYQNRQVKNTMPILNQRISMGYSLNIGNVYIDLLLYGATIQSKLIGSFCEVQLPWDFITFK